MDTWILIESLINFQYVALGESLTLLTDPGQCQRLSTAGGGLEDNHLMTADFPAIS